MKASAGAATAISAADGSATRLAEGGHAPTPASIDHRWPLAAPSQAGGIAVLAATYEGTRSLVFADEADALPATIRRFGGSVVTLQGGTSDAPRGATDGGPEGSIDRPRRLPFADESFDSVFLEATLEALRSSNPGGRSAADPAEQLIRECWRVLRPGGRIVFAVPNELSIPRWRTLVRFRGGRLPRARPGFPAGWKDSVRRHEKLLEAVGFEAMAWYVPWPRYESWSRLLNSRAQAGGEGLPLPGGIPRLLAPLVDVLLRIPGAATWLARDYCGVARKRVSAPPAPCSVKPSVFELITATGHAGAEAGEPLDLRFGHGAGNLYFVGRRFFKLPLAEDGWERLSTEAVASQDLDTTEIGRFTVGPVTTSRIHGVGFVAFPRVQVRTGRNAPAALERVTRACEILGRQAGADRLDRTESWRRIFSAASVPRLEAAGGAALVSHFVERCGSRLVPVGRAHGDLKAANILAGSDDIVIIDWDRFERSAPLLLDPVSAAFRYTTDYILKRGRDAESEMHALRLLLERDARNPLLPHIERVLGELAWWEAIALYVLSYGNHQLARPGARAAPTQANAILRRRMDACLDYRGR